MTQNLQLVHADCLDAMRSMPDNSIGAIVCDPPYGLSSGEGATGGFMGKAWDAKVPEDEIWREAYRVLKPGGIIKAFGGTRTKHRLARSLVNAGFEILRTNGYVFGSGFPKSLNIGKALDQMLGQPQGKSGQGPAVDRTALDYGGATGKAKNGLKADWVATSENTEAAKKWQGWGTALKPAWEPIIVGRKPIA